MFLTTQFKSPHRNKIWTTVQIFKDKSQFWPHYNVPERSLVGIHRGPPVQLPDMLLVALLVGRPSISTTATIEDIYLSYRMKTKRSKEAIVSIVSSEDTKHQVIELNLLNSNWFVSPHFRFPSYVLPHSFGILFFPLISKKWHGATIGGDTLYSRGKCRPLAVIALTSVWTFTLPFIVQRFIWLHLTCLDSFFLNLWAIYKGHHFFSNT